MNEQPIQGLPTIHFLEHPEFYQVSDIRPVVVVPMLSGYNRQQIQHCISMLENIIENSLTSNQESHLGEFLRPMQSAVMQLNYVLKGREVPGRVLVKRSRGWSPRLIENKENQQ